MAAVYKALSKSSAASVLPDMDIDVADADADADAGADAPTKKISNKQRVLILGSRGITHRHRHLMNDLAAMMPHGRRDVKFDQKNRLPVLNELAELYNCNNVLFFEARKGKDLYMYLARPPNGPTLKFHVNSISTQSELHFTGNCLKGSRPILSFDAAFDAEPHLRLIREMFAQQFGVPAGARRSKPFIDHVMGFSIADGKIWARTYEIKEEEAAAVVQKKGDDVVNKKKDAKSAMAGAKDTEIRLVEIGPRFVLTPIIIQEGSFGGPIIYENKEYVSPNQVRADVLRQAAARHTARDSQRVERAAKETEFGLRTGAPRPKRGDDDDLDAKKLFA